MIEVSAFDSEIYGLRIGRLALVEVTAVASTLDAVRAGGFDVVFARADAADTALVDALATRGLHPLETLVTSTLAASPPPAATSPDVTVEHHARITADADVDAIAALTARAITISHFHADPRLPRERTHQLYASWARNDVTGRAQRTLVARIEGTLVGYVTVLRRDDLAIIDLVAVDEAWRGRGVGAALLGSFVTWVTSERLRAQVGTQSDNRALALYQRTGFVPAHRQLTYHLWADECP